MLKMLGSPRRCCDGITRRETLAAGALTALGGFGLPHLFGATESGRVAPGKAKNVIVLYLLGGAATQDMWDLKPDAPVEVRSQFKPIPTSASGIEICEHLPQAARWMHKAAIVRSVNHKAGCHNTLPSYSGHEVMLGDITTTSDSYPPSMGSVCEFLRQQGEQRTRELPDYVYMPCYLGWGQNIRRPGPYGGFLGKQFDPLFTECSPKRPENTPAPIPGNPATVLGTPSILGAIQEGITLDRIHSRKSLLSQMDDQVRRIESSGALGQYDKQKQRAYNLLVSPALKEAFEINREDPKLVERYGNTLFGHSTLLGRRLIERGVRFVNVTWDLFWDRVAVDYDAWDTHTKNFPILKDNKLPGFDQTFSALMEDLETRGLLDETLVVVMSEMGRTPRINASGGRDHWTYCYSIVFAGAGIRGGTVYGASDAQAAYVQDRPVSTSDICATIYQSLGIDPTYRVPDAGGRPIEVAHGGRAISEILA